MFERVAPGEVKISRLIRTGSHFSAGGSPSLVLDVKPGITLRPSLGGTGRPIVGKAILPAALAERDDWLYGICELSRKPPGTGAAGPGGIGSGQRAGDSIVVAIEPDGRFRIEDIESGTYELHLAINKRPADPAEGPLGSQTIATGSREFDVQPMPSGRSDEPLELGSVPIKVVAKLGTAPAAPKPDRTPPRQEPFSSAKVAIPAERKP